MGRPKKDERDKADPNERLVCKICSLEYTRSNKSKHLKSKYHMIVENLTTPKEKKVHRDSLPKGCCLAPSGTRQKNVKA